VSSDIGPVPRYADARYYARFHSAGWHSVRSWGDYITIRLECGRTVSVWDGGDSAAEVVGTAPDGLCAGCSAHDAMAVQTAMTLEEIA
jgi:hypothetical protein